MVLTRFPKDMMQLKLSDLSRTEDVTTDQEGTAELMEVFEELIEKATSLM